RHHYVERGLAKRELERIADHRPRFPGESEAFSIQVENDNAIFARFEKRFADIARSRCDIQYQEAAVRRRRRQIALDRADAAQSSIDDFQFTVSPGKFLFRAAEVIHDLG